MKTGELIRKYRKEKNLTMKELGQIIGVSEQAISQYERGLRNVNLETLLKISAALGTSVNSLREPKLTASQEILQSEFIDKGISLEQISKESGIPLNKIEALYKNTENITLDLYFELYRFLGLNDENITTIMFEDSRINSIYNNDGSDLDKNKLQKMFLKQPMDMELLLHGTEDYNDCEFTDYLFKMGDMYNSNIQNYNDIPTVYDTDNSVDILDTIHDEELKKYISEKIQQMNDFKLILSSHGLDFSINKNHTVKISIPKHNVYSNLDFNVFSDFIDKLSWGIDREIDYFKNSFFDID